jgi:hypothetical protein
LVAVPGSAEVHGVCVSYVFLSIWEQRASRREREPAIDLTRMPVCEEKLVKTFRPAGAPADFRESVTIDGVEVGR